MDSDQIVRWGVIGPGQIARKFARDLKVVENTRIQAVGSRAYNRAKAFAVEFNIPNAYGSYAEMLQDPEIDVVYIATPHRAHFENALASLEAGKAVLCEKPLTVNANESRQLIETAKSNKRFLMEALWTRYLPIYQQIRTWLDQGAIGEIRLMTSTFGFRAERNYQGRLFNQDLAGGSLLDLGIYPIAVSQWVMRDNPVSISVDSLIGETNVDEFTSAQMRYAGDVISQFTSSFQAPLTNDFYIFGTDGHIRIHPPFWGATEATLVKGNKEITTQELFYSQGFEYQIEEVVRCMRTGKLESAAMSHADTLANMTLMDAMRDKVGHRYRFET